MDFENSKILKFGVFDAKKIDCLYSNVFDAQKKISGEEKTEPLF